MKLFWLATIFMAGAEAQTTTVSPTDIDGIGARAKKSKAQREKEREERQKNNKGKNKGKKNRTTTTTSTTTTTTTSTTTTTTTTSTTSTTTSTTTTKPTTKAQVNPPLNFDSSFGSKPDRPSVAFAEAARDVASEASSEGKKRWIPKINQCWTCHEDVDYNATAKAAVENCKGNGKLRTCQKEDVCMVESRIRDGITRQVHMGCKQKTACLTQRGNNEFDCTVEGDQKTCRQCCDGYNCAAKSYFASATGHQTRTLGESGSSLSSDDSFNVQFWFNSLMSDEK